MKIKDGLESTEHTRAQVDRAKHLKQAVIGQGTLVSARLEYPIRVHYFSASFYRELVDARVSIEKVLVTLIAVLVATSAILEKRSAQPIG